MRSNDIIYSSQPIRGTVITRLSRPISNSFLPFSRDRFTKWIWNNLSQQIRPLSPLSSLFLSMRHWKSIDRGNSFSLSFFHQKFFVWTRFRNFRISSIWSGKFSNEFRKRSARKESRARIGETAITHQSQFFGRGRGASCFRPLRSSG